MFNFQILDVAIAMIFVYLMLSLVCSATNEIIELFLKKRAIDLERGIRELLVPDSDSGADDIVRRLYNHSLINGLFVGLYERSRIDSALRYVWRTKLPTYIPSRNFALALMDLVGQPLGPPPTPPAVPGLSTAAGASPGPQKVEVRLNVVPLPPPPPTNPANPLNPLRNAAALTPLLNQVPQTRQTLIALIDAAVNDADKARQNIEDWYNASMDRVSGWYKRRAQVFILIISFIVVIWLNADSIAMVRALRADQNLRELAVAEATKYVERVTSPSPTPSLSPSPAPISSPSPTPTAECPTPACDNDKNSPECKLQQDKCQLKELGVPVGWNSPDDPGRQLPRTWNDVRKQVQWHLLGWLLTVLAISLGAPFWFDMLNKFIDVRSTVKPKEKSPEEKSKD